MHSTPLKMMESLNIGAPCLYLENCVCEPLLWTGVGQKAGPAESSHCLDGQWSEMEGEAGPKGQHPGLPGPLRQAGSR